MRYCKGRKVEESAGVFNVTLKFIEYVPVSVKTTDIPYVKRPGKIPELPKKVVIGAPVSKTSPYVLTDVYRKILEQQGKEYVDYNMKMFGGDGKPVNPCLLEKGKEYTVDEPRYGSSSRAYGYKYENEVGKQEPLYKSMDSEGTYVAGIKNFFDTWNKVAEDFNKKQDAGKKNN